MVESHYLEAELMEYITIACRERDSDNWYVGGVQVRQIISLRCI